MTVEDGWEIVAGFAEHFDLREFDDLLVAIRDGEVDLVISRDRDALEIAVEETIQCRLTAL